MSEQLTAALDASALSTFRDALAGEIVLPDDPSYDAARIVWNGMIDRRPAIVGPAHRRRRCPFRPSVRP